MHDNGRKSVKVKGAERLDPRLLFAFYYIILRLSHALPDVTRF